MICAEGLGKKYIIGHAAQREHYVALRDVLVRGCSSRYLSLRSAAFEKEVTPFTPTAAPVVTHGVYPPGGSAPAGVPVCSP